MVMVRLAARQEAKKSPGDMMAVNLAAAPANQFPTAHCTAAFKIRSSLACPYKLVKQRASYTANAMDGVARV